jgi:hypothetical protein
MQSWHEEELASFAWRWTTVTHADQIISTMHNQAMTFEINRMDASPTNVLSNLHRNFTAGQWQSFPIQNEPEAGACFQYKMSLEG